MKYSHIAYSLFGMLALSQAALAQPTEEIRLNQLGFCTSGPKLAIVSDPNPETFYVMNTHSGDTVYKGRLGEPKQSAYSSTITRLADLSPVRTAGEYKIYVPGLGYSYAFYIGNDVYRNVGKAVIKGFYYQRMSMDIDERYAGKWHRKAGHPDTAVLVHPSAADDHRPAGTVISSPGGWYDAGDYNKYIVNSGITMGTLLSAYEDFPAYFKKLELNIPESGDAIPDVLNETLYNLRWMLTMQDPNDGGVYHKCTNASFDAMIMPDKALKPRYVVQKGTAATLDFAAVMAQAARVFKAYEKQLPGLSDSCLKAAAYAWQWALKNPSLVYDQDAINKTYTPPVTTGAYGDRRFNDEWFWAAAELYATTKNSQYLSSVSERMKDQAALPSWADVTMLGYYTFIRKEKELPSDAHAIVNAMKDSIVRIANRFMAAVPRNAFHTVMGQTVKDFSWGGNSVAANQGILLLYAYKIHPDKKYMAGAQDNLDYILGRNATGYCFITGIGSKSPMHPHHRPSVADGIDDPVPGLMVGGPNPGRQDKCTYYFFEPETSYVDSDCAYAANEIAINWNAPIAYLANAIEAMQAVWKK